MKSKIISFIIIFTFLLPLYVIGSGFEDSSTSIEQEDMKTIGQINDEISFEDESTPIENEDTESFDQVDDENSFENESTPIEQEDMKTINQINN